MESVTFCERYNCIVKTSTSKICRWYSSKYLGITGSQHVWAKTSIWQRNDILDYSHTPNSHIKYPKKRNSLKTATLLWWVSDRSPQSQPVSAHEKYFWSTLVHQIYLNSDKYHYQKKDNHSNRTSNIFSV